jgi:hypothetical protein
VKICITVLEFFVPCISLWSLLLRITHLCNGVGSQESRYPNRDSNTHLQNTCPSRCMWTSFTRSRLEKFRSLGTLGAIMGTSWSEFGMRNGPWPLEFGQDCCKGYWLITELSPWGEGRYLFGLTNCVFEGSVLEHAVCMSIVLINSVCGLETLLYQTGRWPLLRFNRLRLYGQAYENDSWHYSSIGDLAFCNGRGSFESNPIRIRLTVTVGFSPYPLTARISVAQVYQSNIRHWSSVGDWPPLIAEICLRWNLAKRGGIAIFVFIKGEVSLKIKVYIITWRSDPIKSVTSSNTRVSQ